MALGSLTEDVMRLVVGSQLSSSNIRAGCTCQRKRRIHPCRSIRAPLDLELKILGCDNNHFELAATSH